MLMFLPLNMTFQRSLMSLPHAGRISVWPEICACLGMCIINIQMYSTVADFSLWPIHTVGVIE